MIINSILYPGNDKLSGFLIYKRMIFHNVEEMEETSRGFRPNSDEQKKASNRREIVKKYASDRLIYVDGLELLDNSAYISADMTHPSFEGIEQIAHRWFNVMNAVLNK